MKLQKNRYVVTGGNGFLGKHVCAALQAAGITNIFTPRSTDFDLRDKNVCEAMLEPNDVVIHLAGKVG